MKGLVNRFVIYDKILKADTMKRVSRVVVSGSNEARTSPGYKKWEDKLESMMLLNSENHSFKKADLLICGTYIFLNPIERQVVLDI